MTKIPEYVRGYRDAFKDVITLVYMQADKMNDEHAKSYINLLADDLGNASRVLGAREMAHWLRAYVKEHGGLPRHLPKTVADDFETMERTKKHIENMQTKLKEGRIVIRLVRGGNKYKLLIEEAEK